MAERHRILVVDDNEATREFLEVALGGLYEVVSSPDGFDALEKLPKVEPDLIVLDVLMPLMNGFETCRCIRKNHAFRVTPIIFLSAKDDESIVKRTYEAGGSVFIQKPIDAERLLKNIKITIDRAGLPRKKRNPMEELRRLFQPTRREPAGAPTPSPAPAAVPAASAAPTPPAAARATAMPAEPEAAPLHKGPPKPRVMIVDDDPELVTLLTLTLQDEYEMVSAADGLQAIERIIDFQPDILLLDIMMPKMNGFQLSQSLRRNPTYRETPIAFLSAKSSRKDREYAERCGADAFVAKPFDMRKLQELLRAFASKPGFQIRPKSLSLAKVNDRIRAEEQDIGDRRQLRDRRDPFQELKKIIDEAQ